MESLETVVALSTEPGGQSQLWVDDIFISQSYDSNRGYWNLKNYIKGVVAGTI